MLATYSIDFAWGKTLLTVPSVCPFPVCDKSIYIRQVLDDTLNYPSQIELRLWLLNSFNIAGRSNEGHRG